MTREEAIKIVRNIYQTDAEKEALGTLIPELAESEDERMVNALISYFEWYERSNPTITGIPVTIDGFSVRDVIAWLEKRKERKPAEWSEEDENMLWNVISIVGESKSIQADEMLDWLKSLRPSWKPSEEQMEELNKARRFIPYNCDILESLYEQLKEL